MTNEEHLQRHIKIAKALGEMFSPLLEVSVLDYRDPLHAVKMVDNGFITGREVGDKLDEIDSARLSGSGAPDMLVNFIGENSRGQQLRTSSLAIRNDTGELIGALSLKFETSYLAQFAKFLEQFIGEGASLTVPKEQIGAPEDELRDAIETIIIRRHWQSKSLSNAEKKEIVVELQQTGHFNKRGAVTTVAKELRLTRPSVYQYLKSS